jgi:hypothetical protein
MRKSPWVLFIVASLITAVVVFATLSIKIEPCAPTPQKACEPDAWLTTTLLWLKPHAAPAIAVATVLSLIIQGVEKAIGGHGFQKAKVEKFLDEIVRAQFKGVARQHRLTLFKRAGGPKAKLIAWWRVRKVEDPDDRRRKRDAAGAIRWGGTYLYVYARASRSPNKISSAVWRVYRDQSRSQGMAGKAWDEGDVVIARDLTKIQPDTLDRIATLGEADSMVQEYAKLANLDDIVHVRAMRHVAQHFMGVVIETERGEPWGVLLVDSMKDQCPFPKGSQQKKTFEKQFREHATMLSLLLS